MSRLENPSCPKVRLLGSSHPGGQKSASLRRCGILPSLKMDEPTRRADDSRVGSFWAELKLAGRIQSVVSFTFRYSFHACCSCLSHLKAAPLSPLDLWRWRKEPRVPLAPAYVQLHRLLRSPDSRVKAVTAASLDREPQTPPDIPVLRLERAI